MYQETGLVSECEKMVRRAHAQFCAIRAEFCAIRAQFSDAPPRALADEAEASLPSLRYELKYPARRLFFWMLVSSGYTDEFKARCVRELNTLARCALGWLLTAVGAVLYSCTVIA